MLYTTLLSSALTAFSLLHTTSAAALPLSKDLQSGQDNTIIDFSNATPFPFDENNSGPLENVFRAILDIPDDVLDKDDDGVSLNAYLNDHHGAGLSIDVKTGNAISERQSWFDIAKCAFEIGKVILENGIPLAKLRRIKDLMKAIGSAKDIAKMLLKAKSWAELKAIGGVHLMKLAEELAGLQGVVDACFSF